MQLNIKSFEEILNENMFGAVAGALGGNKQPQDQNNLNTAQTQPPKAKQDISLQSDIQNLYKKCKLVNSPYTKQLLAALQPLLGQTKQ